MRRPRRIFRSSGFGARSVHAAWPRTVLVGLVLVGAGALVSLTGLPSDLFGRVPSPSGVIRADEHSVAVVDGDTLRLHETVIRLMGVQAPKRGVSCRAADGHAYDCGNQAAAALGRLVRGLDVACRLDGRDPHGLPQGECDAGGTAVNRAIVASGWARATQDDDQRGDSLAEEERQARAAMRGVWSGAGDPFY